MVADLKDEPYEVEPLPNIDFNIRQGNSLIGFTDSVEVTDDGDASLINWDGGVGSGVRELYEDVINAINLPQCTKTADSMLSSEILHRTVSSRSVTTISSNTMRHFGHDYQTIKIELKKNS